MKNIPLSKNKNRTAYHITTKQIVVLLIGFIILLITSIRWLEQGTQHFFSQSIRFRGRYLNAAYFFIIGMLLFCFGLYDIIMTIKKNKPFKQ
jgi:hypothetical protein